MCMNTFESRRQHLNYYEIYILNQQTSLSFLLKLQRLFQMVSHKNYKLNANEDFCNVFDFQINYTIY